MVYIFKQSLYHEQYRSLRQTQLEILHLHGLLWLGCWWEEGLLNLVRKFEMRNIPDLSQIRVFFFFVEVIPLQLLWRQNNKHDFLLDKFAIEVNWQFYIIHQFLNLAAYVKVFHEICKETLPNYQFKFHI